MAQPVGTIISIKYTNKYIQASYSSFDLLVAPLLHQLQFLEYLSKIETISITTHQLLEVHDDADDAEILRNATCQSSHRH